MSRDLGGYIAGDGPPKFELRGDSPCFRPPTILRQYFLSCPHILYLGHITYPVDIAFRQSTFHRSMNGVKICGYGLFLPPQPRTKSPPMPLSIFFLSGMQLLRLNKLFYKIECNFYIVEIEYIYTYICMYVQALLGM